MLLAMNRNEIKGIASLFLILLLALLGTHILHLTPRNFVAVTSPVEDTDLTSESQKTNTAELPSTISAPKVSYKVSSSTPQFVILSFDGSKSVSFLDETLAFEQKIQAEGKPLHFTYFVNAAYFLTPQNAKLYQAPGEPSGTSMIGFGDSTNDVALRVQEFNKAFSLGNEIGSHSVGHFNGSGWSFDQWKQEFTSFTSLVNNVQQNNPSQHIDAPLFLSNIHGFRAPNLGINDNLYKALSGSGFTYDGSDVNSSDAWPTKDTYGIWHIPLGTIYLGTDRRPVIAMDYSIWTRESQAKEQATQGSTLWNQYYNEVENAYLNYFNTNYNGNRSPIVIADHFSKWNDGVYWEAMKAFAENVCGKPNVQCVTFSDLVNYLNNSGAPSRQ